MPKRLLAENTQNAARACKVFQKHTSEHNDA